MTVKFIATVKNRDVIKRIHNLGLNTDVAINQGFKKVGKDLKITAKRQIDAKDKRGVEYKVLVNVRRRRRRASAAGQSHANRTKALRNAVSYKTTGHKRLEFGYGLSRKSPKYDGYVEDGTENMEARPSLQNAIDEVDRNAEIHFQDEFKKAHK